MPIHVCTHIHTHTHPYLHLVLLMVGFTRPSKLHYILCVTMCLVVMVVRVCVNFVENFVVRFVYQRLSESTLTEITANADSCEVSTWRAVLVYPTRIQFRPVCCACSDQSTRRKLLCLSTSTSAGRESWIWHTTTCHLNLG